MVSSKALLRLLLVANSIAGLFGVYAKVASHNSANVPVPSGTETSTPVIQISYNDLFDLFGEVIAPDYDNEEEDEICIEQLVEVLGQNHHKLLPLLQKIEGAFGIRNKSVSSSSLPALGFLEVTGLPSEVVSLRERLLPRASELANLSAEELTALEKPETGYSIGWSHGKESYRVVDEIDGKSGAPKRRYDTAKGSFYMNPYADDSITNVYPPSMQPELEHDLLIMTKFMSQVGLWIAVLCDLYLGATTNIDCSRDQVCKSRNNSEKDASIDNTDIDFSSSISTNQWMVYKSLKNGRTSAKARFLYYFPQEQKTPDENILIKTENDDVFDDWCGWHTDHGTLTALLPGMLCENDNHEMIKLAKTSLSSSPRLKPGLYIKTKVQVAARGIVRNTKRGIEAPQEFRDRIVHVDLAPDSLGFQLGETLQILSGGKFEATQHAVKAPPSLSIGRTSLAVFLQPIGSQILPPLTPALQESDHDESDLVNNSHNTNADDFSLQRRWRSTFGEFQRVTFETFS